VEYLVYNVRGRSALAFPAARRRLRLAALRRYPDYSFKRRLFRRSLQAAMWLGIDDLWVHRSKTPHEFADNMDFSAWVLHLQRELNRSDLFPVIHGSIQKERRRLYVHLLDQRGDPVAFAKLALDDLSNAQFEREIRMLSAFKISPPTFFHVPMLLCEGNFSGRRYMVVDALPAGASAVALSWESLKGYLQELSGPLVRVLNANEVCATKWWQNFNELACRLSPQFIDELRSLIADSLPIAHVHGDTGIHNLARSSEGLWIIDWEESSDVGPRRTDEIGYYLSTHQQRILHKPRSALQAFAAAFLDDATKDDRRDVMAALAFLAAAGLLTARQIVGHWNEIPKFGRLPTGVEFARPVLGKETVNIAIIADEPAPDRAHLLDRLAAELTEATVHNIYTHSISNPTMPWEMGIKLDSHPAFFPDDHLNSKRFVNRRSLRLFRKIRDYLINHQIRLLVLVGCDDLTRLLLIRWARRRGVLVLLAGDFNVFGKDERPWLAKVIRRRYFHWVLGSIAGVMSSGTCGRAYLRLLRDHDLPEFLFPCEPDYSSLRPTDPVRLDDFRARCGLDAQRRRFLFCGPLTPSTHVDLLVDAFILASHNVPDWDLVIAGDGELRAALHSRIPKQLASRVRFLGFLQPDQKATCYRVCDVLVHPGESEPWGLVINEAVGSGLAVISTELSGAAVELVRHRENGLHIPPRSIRAIADAMEAVVRDDAYRQMKAASDGILHSWRKAADPVSGLRKALRFFYLPLHEEIERQSTRIQDGVASTSPQESLPSSN
jgi:glycosyltransferase involved in cell wall biosynthesis